MFSITLGNLYLKMAKYYKAESKFKWALEYAKINFYTVKLFKVNC